MCEHKVPRLPSVVVSYCMVREVVTYVLARALSISPGKVRYTAEEGAVA